MTPSHFSTAEGDQHDTITDFQSGQDVVNLTGVAADFNALDHIVDTADGAMLTFGDGQTIVFEHVLAADIHASDFHVS